MFTTLIVQPIFNVLVLIYALIPGHNFGLALIIFTIFIRMLLWPLVKKQLHQTKLMRRHQPELQRIAKETKGNAQLRAQLQMEFYKEKGISPFRSIGIALLQLPVLLGLYIGLQRVTKDPHEMVNFAYPFLQNLSWLQELSRNIHLFDSSLFGIVNLAKPAIGPEGLYIPALLIVVGSAVVQYFQASQLLPKVQDGRGLRAIMKDAGQGKQADQSEVSAAVGQSTKYLFPAAVLLFTMNIPSALGLYWLVGGLVAFIQQTIVLREDSDEMQKLGEKAGRKNANRIPEAEVVDDTASGKAKSDKKPAQVRTAPVLPSGTTVTSITRSKKGKKN